METIEVHNWTDYIEEHPDFTGCLINKYNNKIWFKSGKFHREDGPAIEYSNGSKWWCLNNTYYSEQEYRIAMRKIKLERVLRQI